MGWEQAREASSRAAWVLSDLSHYLVLRQVLELAELEHDAQSVGSRWFHLENLLQVLNAWSVNQWWKIARP